MNDFKKIHWAGAIGLMLVLSACSSQKMSDQEKQRQQEILSADNLRNEFQAVAGEYQGTLETTDGIVHDVSLNLLMQDVPVVTDGQPDPVLTPKLVGNLRFTYGDVEAEHWDFPVKSAEYFSVAKNLNVVVQREETELILNLKLNERTLGGSWNASALGTSGSATLQRK